MKTVYTVLTADSLNAGHFNIIAHAEELGEVTVGLLTNKSLEFYKQNYNQRESMVKRIKGVTRVIPQYTMSFSKNLKMLKPNYVVHGEDWQTGVLKKCRDEVIEIIKDWGGELVEIPYTKGISPTLHEDEINKIGTTPEIRLKQLRRLIFVKPIVRVLEVHNGLSGLIAQGVKYEEEGGDLREFDAMWSSSLTDSTSKGKPDIELVDLTSRIISVNEIFEVTNKPLIFDGDTGGKTEHFTFTIKKLERLGVSSIIIEDKAGLKKNSLLGNEVYQQQESIENFCNKISSGKKAQVTKEFMIIARIESLILDKGMSDALVRTESYLNAGADAIMIHSRKKEPNEISTYCEYYRQMNLQKPLVVVPSSYNKVTEQQLIDMGVKVVIYANHMLRAAYPGMIRVAKSILEHRRSLESDKDCLPINDILELIPGTK